MSVGSKQQLPWSNRQLVDDSVASGQVRIR